MGPGRRALARGERAGQALESIFVGEKRQEVGGEIGVASQKVSSIGCLAGLYGLEVFGDGQVEPLLVLGKCRTGLGQLAN